ncbi:hypothetical protein [Limnohabitans sp.]|jgi:hypothetical protein|uniref:hypothetical protein n=1 Tax=Limnohabitans sp. TaxID=1907725 RepID=UPI003BB06CCD|nr:hypothetical protein [Gemmatimonadota bacterium]
MRLLLDPKNEELTDILKTLLTDNIDITAREVARRHSTLKNPSAFTRNEARTALIAAAQAQQHGVRNIVAGSGASGSLQDQVAGYRQEIKRLEDQLTHMVAAHAGLIRAVQMAGGGPALERFWRDYKAVGDAVHSHSAANVERPVANLPLRVVKMSDETAA